MSKFREDLEVLINQNSKENGSDTPDFILADYLADCLDAFDKAVTRRSEWHDPKRDPIQNDVSNSASSNKDSGDFRDPQNYESQDEYYGRK